MTTITQEILGSPGQVDILSITRVDTGLPVSVSPALPQSFDSSDDQEFAFTFTDPDGDCAAGYEYVYSVSTLSPGSSIPAVCTFNGATGPSPMAGMVFAETTVYSGVSPVAGATISYRITVPPKEHVGAFCGEEIKVVADGAGFIRVEVWQFAEYEFWYGRGKREVLITEDQSPVTIPALLSAETANG